jgi:two-component system, oxyanion-binding sensor
VSRELRIGITPLTDSAPIVVAAEREFFAQEGLQVSLSVEPSWANVRDKLAAGALDAAHMLAPMPLAATLGVGPLQQPMGTALSLGLGGNAVTLSPALWRHMQELAPDAMGVPSARGRALAAAVAARRDAGAPPLRLATVFPVSMHGYELRYWLAASGIVPDRDVQLRVVPPPRMVAELEAGAIDGFCVGEPWSSVAVLRGSGVIALTGHDLWSGAPEKVLGVTLDWASRHPEEHRAMLRALLRAARWCDEPEHRPELARLLSECGAVAAPAEALLASLMGALRVGPGDATRRLPDFHRFHRDAASFPWRSHASWILVQMLRWGQIEKAIDVRATAAAVYWTELHREVAEDVGIDCPEHDAKLEGPLLDGARFDAERALDALAAYEVHALHVPMEELERAQSFL